MNILNRSVLFVTTVFFFLAGCSVNQPTTANSIENPSESAIETAVGAALPTQLTVEQPQAAATNTVTPTETVMEQTFNAIVAADTLNLRGGPSMLHNIISQFQKGDSVKLLASAPGNEWVKVLGKDNKIGWVYVTHLTLDQDITVLPVLEINESLVIKGRVVDASGKGIPGIQIAVTRLGANRARVTAISTSDGIFFAYAPVEYQGDWLASAIGVDCKSPIVDANCRYAGVFYPVEGINVTLPTFEEMEIVYQ
jgi:hypothetical protein